jgi:hypothetical protein
MPFGLHAVTLTEATFEGPSLATASGMETLTTLDVRIAGVGSCIGAPLREATPASLASTKHW